MFPMTMWMHVYGCNCSHTGIPSVVFHVHYDNVDVCLWVCAVVLMLEYPVWLLHVPYDMWMHVCRCMVHMLEYSVWWRCQDTVQGERIVPMLLPACHKLR